MNFALLCIKVLVMYAWFNVSFRVNSLCALWFAHTELSSLFAFNEAVGCPMNILLCLFLFQAIPPRRVSCQVGGLSRANIIYLQYSKVWMFYEDLRNYVLTTEPNLETTISTLKTTVFRD